MTLQDSMTLDSYGECGRDEKTLREHLTEKQIDKMVEDSFPASDPPSTY